MTIPPDIPTPSTITIDDFMKVQICVGLVTAASAVPDSKKLIQLTVDLGPTIGTRTILTGLLAHFPDLALFTNKKFLFLVNLAPRKMAGIDSQGMFLIADSETKLTLIPASDDAVIGARLH